MGCNVFSPSEIKEYITSGYINNNFDPVLEIESEKEDIFEAFIQVVESVGDRFDKIAIHLTGGKDTGFIAALCKHLDVPFVGFTYVVPYSRDILVASKVAKILDVDLIYLHIDDMLFQDRLVQYSLLGCFDDVHFSFEKYYNMADICLSGWGLTETCYAKDVSQEFIFNYLHQGSELQRKKMGVHPIVFEGNILSRILGFEKNEDTNLMIELLKMIRPGLLDIEYVNSGLPLRFPWKVHLNLWKWYNLNALLLNKPNPHVGCDGSFFIRNCIDKKAVTDCVNAVFNKYPVFDRNRALDKIELFYQRRSNYRMNIVRFLILEEIFRSSDLCAKPVYVESK